MTSARSAVEISWLIIKYECLYKCACFELLHLHLLFFFFSYQVKYREKYISSLGTWKSIPDRPEFFFSKIVSGNVSDVSTLDFFHPVLKYLQLMKEYSVQ